MRRFSASTEPRLHLLRSLVLGLCLLSPARAYILDGPRNIAMGGATRGDPVGNTAILSNPAGLARTYVYGAQVAYTRAPGKLNMGGVNVADSKTNPDVAVGLAYGYLFSDSDAPDEVDGHDVKLGFAHPLIRNRLSLGVALHYMRFDHKEGDDLEGFTLDGGVLFSLTPSLSIGLAGENLIKRDHPRYPRRAGGGVAFSGERFTVDLDVMGDFDSAEKTKPVYAAGLELLLSDAVPVRLGFRRDEARDRSIAGGGLGFVNASGAGGSQLEFSYEQDLDDSEQYRFTIALTTFL